MPSLGAITRGQAAAEPQTEDHNPMTTPTERQRALLQAGAFLKQLAADASLPDDVRVEAHRLLRHFPRRSDLPFLAEVAALPQPGPEEQAHWLRGYAQGAHDGA